MLVRLWYTPVSQEKLEARSLHGSDMCTLEPSVWLWEDSNLSLTVNKISADGDCSHEIKRCLLLGRKVMTHLGSILKSRNYFVNKGLSSQSYGFSSSHVRM